MSCALLPSPGTPVFARWKDKHFYPGKISEVKSDDGRYTIAFVDDVLRVRESDVIVCELAPVGQAIMAERGDEGKWSEAAVVLAHYTAHRGQDKGYVVEFADSSQHRQVLTDNLLTTDSAKGITRVLSYFDVYTAWCQGSKLTLAKCWLKSCQAG